MVVQKLYKNAKITGTRTFIILIKFFFKFLSSGRIPVPARVSKLMHSDPDPN